MLTGRGRPVRDRSEVGKPRSLTPADVANLERAQLPAAQKFRDSYHAVARCAALGLRNDEIASETGYGVERIRQLLADPTMQARIEAYRELVMNPAFVREADAQMKRKMECLSIGTRLLKDKLVDAEPEDISIRDLLNVITVMSDRTGYGKISTVKVQHDLADRLAQALAASSKVIDARPLKDITPKEAA